jgi:O-antigen ligase
MTVFISRGNRATGLGLLTAAGLVASAFAGAALTVAPRVGLGAVVAIVVAAVLIRVASWPLPEVVVAAAVISSGLVDVPRRLAAGPFSGGAAITTVSAGLVVLVWVGTRRDRRAELTRPLLPLALFVIWALTTCLYHPPSVNGLQNVLVWIGALGVAAITAYATYRRLAFVADLEGVLVCCFVLGIGLYAASVLLGGFGAGNVAAPRAFALFALVALSYGLAIAKTGRREGLLLAIVASALIVASLSRLATGVAAFVWCLGALNPTTFRGWMRFSGGVLFSLGVFIAAVLFVAPLHERFIHGDVTTVAGGAKLNLEGRAQLWSATWDSYKTSPIIGHGAGTADDLIKARYGTAAGHPHEDYLRILHDYGAVGLALWILAFVSLLRSTWRGWRRSLSRTDGPPEWPHYAAFLALVSVGLGMLTDNVMIYPFVMIPVGALVGLSLGLQAIASNRSEHLT